VPAKSRRRGIAWKGAWTGVGYSNVEPAGLGGGLHGGLATNGWAGVDGDDDTTLGGSCVGPLSGPASGVAVGGRREGQGAATIPAVQAIPPLDGQASGSEVAGRRDAQVVAMIRRCLEGW
jgi:hypothetical protein